MPVLFRVKVPAFNGLNVCCAANIAIEHCPQCGGDLKIIAAIEEPAVIVIIKARVVLQRADAPARLCACVWWSRWDEISPHGSTQRPTNPRKRRTFTKHRAIHRFSARRYSRAWRNNEG